MARQRHGGRRPRRLRQARPAARRRRALMAPSEPGRPPPRGRGRLQRAGRRRPGLGRAGAGGRLDGARRRRPPRRVVPGLPGRRRRRRCRPARPVDDDPVAAWQHHADAVQALLDDPATATESFTHPHAGTHRSPSAIDRFYTTDVFMHTWDLARATGQDDRLDEDFARHPARGHGADRGAAALLRSVRRPRARRRRRARRRPADRLHRPRPRLAAPPACARLTAARAATAGRRPGG